MVLVFTVGLYSRSEWRLARGERKEFVVGSHFKMLKMKE